MKLPKINRRRFIWSFIFGAPAAVFADSYWIEPNWLKVRKIRLSEHPTHRFVHFTDLHHKGDKKFLESVVKEINKLSPDFVCMTGDIIEESSFLTEALEILSGIKSPIYGVPGNHDYWAHADFDEIAEAFNKTGGAWLVDSQVLTRDRKNHNSRCGRKTAVEYSTEQQNQTHHAHSLSRMGRAVNPKQV